MRILPSGSARCVGVLCAALLLAPETRPATSAAAVREGPAPAALRGRQMEAARVMARSLESIRRLRLSKGLLIDPVLDPNRTGIVGDEFSP
ncbi:MAG: hypothetical protein EHM24_07160, partial [Acidobacteria bacterium]